MPILSYLKQLFGKKAAPKLDPELLASVPDPLIPWAIYGDEDPYILRCTQGLSEFWLDHILMPYWTTLTDHEQAELLAQAPTQEWREWLERAVKPERIESLKEYHKRHNLPFDYKQYIDTFKEAYAEAPEGNKR